VVPEARLLSEAVAVNVPVPADPPETVVAPVKPESVPYSKVGVVEAPFADKDPLITALVSPTLVAACVVAVGASAFVVKLRIEPFCVLSLFVPWARK